MTDLLDYDRLKLSLIDIEIRVQMKEADRRKGMDEVLKEAGEKLKDQCNIFKDRPRLMRSGKKGNELILKYQILRGNKLEDRGEIVEPGPNMKADI